MNKKLLWVIIGLAVIIVVILGVNMMTDKDADTIKIGLITPETGAVSSYGISVRNAVQLGVEYVNKNGGVLGKQIELIVYDDKGEQIESANAAKKLIDQDNVSLIIGPVITPCVLAVAPIAQDSKIPMITPTGTGDTITDIGEYIFRACYKDSFQGRVMAKFAYDELELTTAAIIFDVANDYSRGLKEAFVAEFEGLGGKVVAVESYSTGDSDFNAQLTKIKAANPEALFVPDYHSAAGPIAYQARELGIEVPFLGVDGWDSPDLAGLAQGREKGAYIVNHYSAQDESETTQNFISSYKEKFNAEPDALAALGYDAVFIVKEAIENAGSDDRQAIRDALAETKDVVAATGMISLDESGSPIKEAVILQNTETGWDLITKIRP